MCCFLCFFFKQKTAYDMRISDWSSDVCSSDLENTSRLQEKGFLIEQESGGREIVIGKSHINLEFRENNDWFDIHARVQFGEYEIPFLALKNHILNRIREFELPDGKIAIIPDSWFSDYSKLYALTEGSTTGLT